MSPIMIEIILWYYVRCDEYGRTDNNFNAPVVQEAISFLLMEGMLEKNAAGSSRKYVITEKGRAYIDGLCRVSVPVAKTSWIVEMNGAGDETC